MSLYTFIMEYRGGTYISQTRALSPKQAVKRWAHQLNPKEIRGFGETTKKQIVKELNDDTPIAVNGVSKTWCCAVLCRGHLALINFVETVE